MCREWSGMWRGGVTSPGEGLSPSLPRKFWYFFYLKWLVLVRIPLYILTEILGYLQLGPRQLQYIAGG